MKRILAWIYLASCGGVALAVITYALTLMVLEALRGNQEARLSLFCLITAVSVIAGFIAFLWALSEVEK